jgi:hypothetical protein
VNHVRFLRAFGAFLLLTTVVNASAHARPIITEPAAVLERWMFESGIRASYRRDTFRSPSTDYETVRVPVDARLGFPGRLELGLGLDFVSQRLETDAYRYDGSQTSLFNPQIKFNPIQNVGLLFIYHMPAREESRQQLSIARGDDAELMALFHLPLRVPVEWNIGYLFRNSYTSQFGIRGGPRYTVEPGDIFETSLAAEIPVRWGLAILTEAAYYTVGEQSVGGVKNTESDGDALDALIGLTWTRAGWSLATGVDFGLLDESHTSFDLERGAGDFRWHWMARYRLNPRKRDLGT